MLLSPWRPNVNFDNLFKAKKGNVSEENQSGRGSVTSKHLNLTTFLKGFEQRASTMCKNVTFREETSPAAGASLQKHLNLTTFLKGFELRASTMCLRVAPIKLMIFQCFWKAILCFEGKSEFGQPF